ncbi:TraB/GumN family protein [Desulfosudis oleivorans]|uniref:TraB family protein n=1 Tax=Desulfosudis oleivorans (strain DSM 6200 / JCM 39069 / Hxd3) TaxID=96561 RepID=A8ZXA9_DESOH|nr:TraB/GumN family protein [Desulfosudis oleivorans]ABW68488.1 TraB family protein [Desulfosudis oleivorans Hxd3]
MTSDDNIHHLHAGDKEILLVGTAHVSRQSAEQVTQVIEAEQPDTVCVELCRPRFEAVRNREHWRQMDILKVVRDKKAFMLLANLLLAAFQKKIAEKFGIAPGQDMISAIETAEKIGAKIHLADREIRATLARAWRSMGLWGKSKLLFQLVGSLAGADEISEEEIEKLKQEDMLHMVLAELEASHPMLRKIIIDERDQYLAHSIYNAPGKKIVAVVGAGHVAGIKRYWNTAIDIQALETVPPPGISGKVIKWGIPALIIAVFVLGFALGGRDTGMHLLGLWILANSTLAGLGALAAWGHPLTILAAAVSAPITSVNPAIGAGWVAGLVEALVRRPTVGDLEDLSSDITSFGGFWRNRVTRVLLVVVLVNLGSTLGTFGALPLMARLFH